KPLVDEAIERTAEFASHLKVTVKNEVAGAMLEADRPRMLRVMINLLINAIKFSPDAGQVTIVSNTAKDHFELRVNDEGPGIPADLSSAIFELYVQIPSNESSATAKKSQIRGAGIGLPICRAIVEAHSGLIGVEPRNSGGSSFWLRLPV